MSSPVQLEDGRAQWWGTSIVQDGELQGEKGYGKYLDLQYRTLQAASQYREVMPCIKRYLITQIQGQMIQVPPEEWMKTIFLPLENFQKRSRSFVWQQSKRISMGRPYG